MTPTLEQILDRCEPDAVYGCMRWTGPRGSNGRPVLFAGRSVLIPYRVAKELAEGEPCPPDHVVGHRCADETCCRPLHLEYVTKSENEKQKNRRHLMRRKACPRGHAMTDRSRLLSPCGGLLCRECVRDDRKAFRP